MPFSKNIIKFAALNKEKMKNLFHIFIAMLFSVLTLSAQETPDAVMAAQSDSAVKVSLLTCSPGDQIHRLYGHTALRVQSAADDGLGSSSESVAELGVAVGTDWAVNFGWFSFNTPNFVMKFILGLTDYSMAYQTMAIFVMDMVRDDMGVTEQQLNLTDEEARMVQRKLNEILLQDGYDRHNFNFPNSVTGGTLVQTILGAKWTYRYNFLYDNCTTRAVKIVEDAVKASGETIVYQVQNDDAVTTQRDMIHEYTRNSPWYEFGQDLLLGPEVDEPRTERQLAEGLNFLPVYAQNFFEAAQIRAKDGTLRPLVAQTSSLTPYLSPKAHQPAFPVAPHWVFLAIFLFALMLTTGQVRAAKAGKQVPVIEDAEAMRQLQHRQRAWRIWGNSFDIVCWTAQTFVGILLVIMVGWSEHPAVGTNWLLLVFNPLYLLGIPCRLWFRQYEKWFGGFVLLMAVATIIVVVADIQTFPVAIAYITSICVLRTYPIFRFPLTL